MTLFFARVIVGLYVFFAMFGGGQEVQAQKAQGCCEYRNDKNEITGCISEFEFGTLDSEELCKLKGGKYFPGQICDSKNRRCQYCESGKVCLQAPFPGSDTVERAINSNQNPLLVYIKVLFEFVIWLAIFLAIFMVMFAGFMWLTAGGSPDRVGRAKDYISNAIFGLVIALFSFVILQTINPKLVDLQIPDIPAPKLVTSSGKCCFNKNADPGVRFIEVTGEGESCNQLNALYRDGWSDNCPNITSCCRKEGSGGSGCVFNISEKTCLDNGPFTYYYSDIETCSKKDICLDFFDDESLYFR